MGKVKEYDMLIEEYIERSLDGVDIDTLYDMAFDNMRDALEVLPMNDVIGMIEENYPDILEGTSFENYELQD